MSSSLLANRGPRSKGDGNRGKGRSVRKAHGHGHGHSHGRAAPAFAYMSDQPARPSTVDIFGANSALYHAYEQIKKINKNADTQSRHINASVQQEVNATVEKHRALRGFADADADVGAQSAETSPSHARSPASNASSPRGGGRSAMHGGTHSSALTRSPSKKGLAPLNEGSLSPQQAVDARSHEMRNIHFAADHLVQAYKFAATKSNLSTETIVRTNNELLKVAKSVQRTSLCFQEVLAGLTGVPRYQAQVRILAKIEKTYVNLFEKLLKNVTLLERARIRIHEEEWREKGHALERAKVLVPKLSQQLTALKQMLESQKAMIQQQKDRNAEQEKTIADLLDQARAQAQTIEKLRRKGGTSGNSIRELSQSITDSGTTAGAIMQEMRVAESKKQKLLQQMDKSRALLVAEANAHRNRRPVVADPDTGQPVVVEEPECADSSSQTEADDDGLWGVDEFSKFLKVTPFVSFRLWHKAFRFVRCPRCKGRASGPESLKYVHRRHALVTDGSGLFV